MYAIDIVELLRGYMSTDTQMKNTIEHQLKYFRKEIEFVNRKKANLNYKIRSLKKLLKQMDGVIEE